MPLTASSNAPSCGCCQSKIQEKLWAAYLGDIGYNDDFEAGVITLEELREVGDRRLSAHGAAHGVPLLKQLLDDPDGHKAVASRYEDVSLENSRHDECGSR